MRVCYVRSEAAMPDYTTTKADEALLQQVGAEIGRGQRRLDALIVCLWPMRTEPLWQLLSHLKNKCAPSVPPRPAESEIFALLQEERELCVSLGQPAA